MTKKTLVCAGMLLGVAVLATGCMKSPNAAANNLFSRSFSCPAGRITTRPAEGPPPPAELHGDPERIALWKKNVDSTYVRAEGCGERMTYECFESSNADGTGHYMFCTPSYPAVQGEVLQRAAVDLHCPAPSLRVVRSNGWVEVEGCGVHAIYRLGLGAEGWVVTTAPALLAPAAPGAPAAPTLAQPVPSDGGGR